MLCCSIVLSLYRFKPCGHSRNHYCQHHRTHTAAPLTNYGCQSTQSTQHETGYQCVEHIAVFTGRRNDDSEEHSVERDTQCCHHRMRQQTASHDADGTARCPEQRRNQCCRVSISRWRIARMGNGDAKYLVSHATSHQYAVEPRRAWCNLLRQCRTHQHIAQVGHQTHRHHFHICCLNCYQRVSAVFTCGSTGEETRQESLWWCQSSLCRNDSQRESHGKISHCNRYAVTQSVDDMLSIPCHLLKVLIL